MQALRLNLVTEEGLVLLRGVLQRSIVTGRLRVVVVVALTLGSGWAHQFMPRRQEIVNLSVVGARLLRWRDWLLLL